VRAREDARGDLMRTRHRLSKLLLRHGLVYGASAWTRGCPTFCVSGQSVSEVDFE
jgi:hypothetical protein